MVEFVKETHNSFKQIRKTTNGNDWSFFFNLEYFRSELQFNPRNFGRTITNLPHCVCWDFYFA